MFLDDPADVPGEVADHLGEHLDIEDASVLKAYGERGNTRLDHVRELRRLLEYREFAEAEPEQRGWVDARTSRPAAAGSRPRPTSRRAATRWPGRSSTAYRPALPALRSAWCSMPGRWPVPPAPGAGMVGAPKEEPCVHPP
nr:DUF4158 domain-containing protein [Streptomyces venezuelae]